MNVTQFLAFKSLVYELTGVSISDSKREMLVSRVSRRMLALNIDSFSQYYKHAKDDEQEQLAFINQVTTHETRFFRTPHIWEYLQRDFLPNWHANNPTKCCKIWSAGSSSGEEAYSLAITMKDFLRTAPGFKYAIHGTDVSQEMIDHCKRALYNQRSVEYFSEAKPWLFRRYITQTDKGFEVCDTVKECTSFFRKNLFEQSAQSGDYDLVLLRNVLIYFSREDQLKVLRSVHRDMHESGVLIIGESEYMADLDDLFVNTHPLVYQALDNSYEPFVN